MIPDEQPLSGRTYSDSGQNGGPDIKDRPNMRPCPFNLRWIHGYNPKVGVINLNKNGCNATTALYAASNCGVLYNWSTRQMKILQGHTNFVTCIASDKAGKWLVTADSGPENILSVWDSERCLPCRTLFMPHGHLKISKVAISGDAKYLLTLAYQEKAVIHWWIWSHSLEVPHAVFEVDMPRESVIMMEFNPEDTEQFVMITKQDLYIGNSCVREFFIGTLTVRQLMGNKKVIIDEQDRTPNMNDDTYLLNVTKPDKKMAADMGMYTYFTFVSTTGQILVTTSKGSIVIYGYTIEYNTHADSSNIENLKCVKVIKVDKHKINVIKCIDDFVVTGNKAGEIKFYDDQCKLLYWCEHIRVDCVKGLSFNVSPRSFEILNPKCKTYCECCDKAGPDRNPFTGDVHHKLIQGKVATNAAAKSVPFVVRDFLVQTDNQGIGFVDFVSDKYRTILDYRKSYITAMSVHVEKPLFCLGYMDGTVELVNYETHNTFAKLDLRDHFKIVVPPKEDSIRSAFDITIPSLSVTCLKYSPSGVHLACGLNNGELLFLDPLTIKLLNEKPFRDTKYAISHICYSDNSMTMAFADTGKTVCVYTYSCQKLSWEFLAKHRAHYKDINSLMFLSTRNPDGYCKLLSFGQDRAMVEYDIGKSTGETLQVASLDRIEQAAVPLCGMEWPAPKEIDCQAPLLLIANDEYKYKIGNCQTAMTLGTFLGPRYEDPVSKVMLVRKKMAHEGGDYLVFATKKVIGLQKMPLDGNPYKHVGVLCHPKNIIVMEFREDIDSLFTLGIKDNSVCQWATNFKSVEETTLQGGHQLDPYYCLIEGGKPGWLFQEMRDLFYYIQILCQGTFSPAIRRVGDFIPIESLPDIMRALGFFPSEFEVENLITHAKYNLYEKEPATLIDFDDFVRLYLNHRPAFGDNIGKIKSAFRNFANVRQETLEMSRQDFIETLNNFGECFSNDLTWYLLSILSGHSFEERAQMNPEDFSFLPEHITFSDFAGEILGIQDVDINASEQYSVLSSMGSQQTCSTSTQDSSGV